MNKRGNYKTYYDRDCLTSKIPRSTSYIKKNSTKFESKNLLQTEHFNEHNKFSKLTSNTMFHDIDSSSSINNSSKGDGLLLKSDFRNTRVADSFDHVRVSTEYTSKHNLLFDADFEEINVSTVL
ncbi:uncharacterized protein LOC116416607 [Nasonia vitripennis]|uniref:Uncharacterized protein n=1 Tax=Nasonia vitripennis TaxID=7425 RepID=A0A7M7IT19_NASVI|nr:uncharacterized protein LOC107981575 [Nasonia vitripennis]XP_031781418.1 uncharacterized protein LOC116416607 [Nasonia vitripennis]